MTWLDDLRARDPEAAEIVAYHQSLEALGAREWREKHGEGRALVPLGELQRLGRKRLKRLGVE